MPKRKWAWIQRDQMEKMAHALLLVNAIFISSWPLLVKKLLLLRGISRLEESDDESQVDADSGSDSDACDLVLLMAIRCRWVHCEPSRWPYKGR